MHTGESWWSTPSARLWPLPDVDTVPAIPFAFGGLLEVNTPEVELPSTQKKGSEGKNVSINTALTHSRVQAGLSHAIIYGDVGCES